MKMAAEGTSTNLASKFFGHLGLISGMCSELGIAELIDEAIPSNSPDKKVSYGQCVVAMILNGFCCWIFDCFVGIHLLIVNDLNEIILNLQDRHRIILECLGAKYRELYS